LHIIFKKEKSYLA